MLRPTRKYGVQTGEHSSSRGSDASPCLCSSVVEQGFCKAQVASSNLVEGLWGISSVGRAPALQAGCQEFESPILHNGLATPVLTSLGEKRTRTTTHVSERWDPSRAPLLDAAAVFSFLYSSVGRAIDC
jgi:hypothetical protein